MASSSNQQNDSCDGDDFWNFDDIPSDSHSSSSSLTSSSFTNSSSSSASSSASSASASSVSVSAASSQSSGEEDPLAQVIKSEVSEFLCSLPPETAVQVTSEGLAQELTLRIDLPLDHLLFSYGELLEQQLQQFQRKSITQQPLVVEPVMIAERVYIGSEEQGRSRDFLRAIEATCAVIVDPECAPHFEDSLAYWKLSNEDLIGSREGELVDELVAVYKYISNVIESEPTSTVLIYCRNGGPRTLTVALAYIMLSKNWPCAKALEYLGDLLKHPPSLTTSCVTHLAKLDEQMFGLLSFQLSNLHLNEDPDAGEGQYPKLDLSIFYL